MRFTDWDVRLADWATEALGKPFVWGETDCAQLCLQAVDAMTGSQLVVEHGGRYASELEAARYQKRAGTVDQVLAAAGAVYVHPGFEQRGDIIVVPGEAWPQAHVCLGSIAISSTVEQGVGRADTYTLLTQSGVRILRAL